MPRHSPPGEDKSSAAPIQTAGEQAMKATRVLAQLPGNPSIRLSDLKPEEDAWLIFVDRYAGGNIFAHDPGSRFDSVLRPTALFEARRSDHGVGDVSASAHVGKMEGASLLILNKGTHGQNGLIRLHRVAAKGVFEQVRNAVAIRIVKRAALVERRRIGGSGW